MQDFHFKTQILHFEIISKLAFQNFKPFKSFISQFQILHFTISNLAFQNSNLAFRDSNLAFLNSNLAFRNLKIFDFEILILSFP